MSKYQEVLKDLGERVAQMLDEGYQGGDWKAPWDAGNGMPTNWVTGKRYRGMNIMLLMMEAPGKAPDNRWAGYKQWKKAGYQVRKGEHGVKCMHWAPKVKEKDDGTVETFMVGNTFTVFGSAQLTEALPVTEPRHHDPGETDAWILRTGIEIQYGGGKAFYVPAKDKVVLPQVEAFHSPEGYYATALHELTHATGHEGRCDRNLRGRFGDDDYAFEELVAEMGSAFLCHELGVTNEMREDHVQYLASWARQIREDPKVLVKAGKLAEDAAEWLCHAADEKQERGAA